MKKFTNRVLKNDGYLLLADFWKPFPIHQFMNLFIPFSNDGDVKMYLKQEIIDFLKSSGFLKVNYQKKINLVI